MCIIKNKIGILPYNRHQFYSFSVLDIFPRYLLKKKLFKFIFKYLLNIY